MIKKSSKSASSVTSKKKSIRKKSSSNQSTRNVESALTEANNKVARKLAKFLGYQFSDPGLLIEAITHRSKQSVNNERLEFLGDSVLGYVISSELFRRFPSSKEGKLSRGRASLVKGETLAQMAKAMSLGDFLLMGPGEMKSGGHRRDSILADAMEAIIGAIYLDGGLEAAREYVLRIFKNKLEEISLDRVLKDPKTQLQEYLQARKKPLPKYLVVKTTGSDHDQMFEIECQVEGIKKQFIGTGKNRRRAEQDAAAKVLARLAADDA